MFCDTHCHLCPGLDDGPRDEKQVLAMCQQAWNEGIRAISVTAHQNERWQLRPVEIISATNRVREMLDEIGCDIRLEPVGEVMIGHDTVEKFKAGELLTYADQGKYLLIEFPHGLFLDIRDLIEQFVDLGVRPVLAHAERYPELLISDNEIQELVTLGCVVQLSAGFTEVSRADQLRIRKWVNSGLVHVIGSDAHSDRRRRPKMQAAFQQLCHWTDHDVGRRICWDNGMALLNGDTILATAPIAQASQQKSRSWLAQTLGWGTGA